MKNYKKTLGARGENIVCKHYQDLGFQIIEKNYTIRGGEIDLIMENEELIVFIEVKTVSKDVDLFDYISPSKMATLKKTIKYYIWQNSVDKLISLDVVFVRNGHILAKYENVNNG